MKLIDDVDYSTENNSMSVSYDLKWAEKYILRQGPLEYFVHHNTLHAFENEHFFDALSKAKKLFQSQTHMPISWYRQELERGRISQEDLQFYMVKHLGKSWTFPEILNWDENSTNDIEIDKITKKELDTLTIKERTKDDFFQVCSYWKFTKNQFKAKKLRKNLEELKFKILSAYFDKGTSYWEMEEREKGLRNSFEQFINALPPNPLNKKIKKAFQELNLKEINLTIEKYQQTLLIPQKFLKNILFQVLNESKGWTGLVYSLCENSNFNPTEIRINKNDYIFLCLVFDLAGFTALKESNELDSFQYEEVKNTTATKEIIWYLYSKKREKVDSPKDFFLFHQNDIQKISFHRILKIWQEAYESKLLKELVLAHKKNEKRPTEKLKRRPRLQVITCIDDREESTRRHFEEFSDNIETFGYAGHFGLNIKYKSLRDAHFRALCPVNAVASKYVFEEVIGSEQLNFKALARIKRSFFHNSHLPFLGSLLSLVLGPFIGMLFLFERISPKMVYGLRKKLKQYMFPKLETNLNFLQTPNRLYEGFTDEELAQVAANLISITGLNHQFGDIIFICGHGSKSMNNPHGAAYNCGACAGGKGAPNARLMAEALNRAQVREILKSKGITIPPESKFVGGYHCTSTGKILIFENKYLLEEKMNYQFLKDARDFVQKRDSKERMRKFENVPLKATIESAFLAAQNRSYDFSQPRPEYGHNTNAFCLVGKRSSSESLFLDRRAFLVSYDAENDLLGENLLALLSAVIPVCAGISLEYYFSYVNQKNFGAGLKQGHNVTSLVGVINGYQSDLQMGLPWQMVEIHEPSRIIFLIEAEQSKFENVLEKNSEVRNLVKNEWVRVILKNEHKKYLLYGKDAPLEMVDTGVQPLTTYKNSLDYCADKREILPIAIKGGF